MIIDRLPNVVITTLTGLVITKAAVTLEIIVTSLCDVDVWGDVRAGVTIDVVTDIGVDVLTADTMTALDFALPALLEESKVFC